MSKLVVNAKANDGNGATLANNFCNSRAETADDGMLLSGNDSAGLLSRLKDNILINGLDGVDVYNANADTFVLA